MRKQHSKCYPFRRKVVGFCQFRVGIGFFMPGSSSVVAGGNKGLVGCLSSPQGGYLLWHQHGCTTRGSLAPRCAPGTAPCLPAFPRLFGVWSFILVSWLYPMSLLLPELPGSCFLFPSSPNQQSTTTVRVLGERVRQQNIAPRPAYLFNACFLRHATC